MAEQADLDAMELRALRAERALNEMAQANDVLKGVILSIAKRDTPLDWITVDEDDVITIQEPEAAPQGVLAEAEAALDAALAEEN